MSTRLQLLRQFFGQKTARFAEYVWAQRPDATKNYGHTIVISDVGRSPALFRSDGTDWRPVGAFMGPQVANYELEADYAPDGGLSTDELVTNIIEIPSKLLLTGHEIEASVAIVGAASVNAKTVKVYYNNTSTTVGEAPANDGTLVSTITMDNSVTIGFTAYTLGFTALADQLYIGAIPRATLNCSATPVYALAGGPAADDVIRLVVTGQKADGTESLICGFGWKMFA